MRRIAYSAAPLLALTLTAPASAAEPCGPACLIADSCSQPDVQAAIDEIRAAAGGTVRVPDPTADACEWSSPVVIDATSVPIVVEGQSEETTRIRATAAAFEAAGAAGVGWSISRLRLLDGACSDASCDTLIGIGGDATEWRIHHLTFETTGVFTRLIRTSGPTSGLIDHVTVRGTTPSEFVTADGIGFAGWKEPVALGAGNAVFVEDCDILFTGAWEGRPFDGENGGRMVVRHNRIQNQILGSHGFDSGDGSSIFSVVAYGNTFVIDDTPEAPWDNKTWARFTHFRGGTGLLYDNHWQVGDDIWINGTLDLAIYRTPTDAGGNEHWLPCDGTAYGMCSSIARDWSWVGNDPPYNCATDQDCIDAIGAGATCRWRFCSASRLELCEVDDDCPGDETCTASLDGDGPDGYPCFQQPGFATQMQPHPWYEWSNTFEGGDGSSGCGSPPCDVDFGEDVGQLEPGRDYFDDVAGGATLPATCTPLEAFWNSAEQVLYRCESADAWAPYYEPYPYPHPLQTGAAGAGGEGGAGATGGAGGAGADGGTGATGGAGGAGAGGAGAVGENDDGCGCRIGAAHAPRGALLLLALVGALLPLRRRRFGPNGPEPCALRLHGAMPRGL